VNKEILEVVIEKVQDQLINELCGRKYARNRNAKFTRAGSDDRTFRTRHGTIKFKLAKVRSSENESILRPLLLDMGVEPCKRIVEDLDFECTETATYLTYRDSKTVIENLTKAKVSKHRIHSCVQKVGAYIDKKRRETQNKKVDLLYADGTKAHGQDGKKNEITVIIENR